VSVNHSFQFVALSYDPFKPYFDLDDASLRALHARRVVVDEKPGFPCRVSLVDADIGETVLLIPYTHHDVSGPYRASGPIFVRRDARTATPAVNEIPAMFSHRLLSVRAYDAAATLVGAEVVECQALESAIRKFFTDNAVNYLHLHNARPGCYNCRVVRA
jgi:hypothetical protein